MLDLSTPGRSRGVGRAGMLFYCLIQAATSAPPATYRDNAQSLVTKESRRAGRTGLPGKPRTLALPPLDRPWRQGPPNG